MEQGSALSTVECQKILLDADACGAHAALVDWGGLWSAGNFINRAE